MRSSGRARSLAPSRGLRDPVANRSPTPQVVCGGNTEALILQPTVATSPHLLSIRQFYGCGKEKPPAGSREVEVRRAVLWWPHPGLYALLGYGWQLTAARKPATVTESQPLPAFSTNFSLPDLPHWLNLIFDSHPSSSPTFGFTFFAAFKVGASFACQVVAVHGVNFRSRSTHRKISVSVVRA